MKKKSVVKSTERTLIFSTGLVFTTYLYLTVKSFQRLPPVPSLQEILDTGKGLHTAASIHSRQEAGDEIGGSTHNVISGLINNSNNSAATAGESLTSPSIEEMIAKQSKFPQSIDFGNLKEEIANQAQNNNRKSNNHNNIPKKQNHELTYDRDQLEEIVHPAVELLPSLSNEIDNLIVPKFYNPPIFEKYGGIREYLGNFGERLMTVKEAKSIGSFVPNYNTNSKEGGEPSQLETIFVAIASYRDFQCQQTIESIISRAKYPQRVRIAVVDQLDYQHDKPCSEPKLPCDHDPDQILCKFESQIDFYEMDASFAVGPVFARHLGHRMYRGEYFAMQCDAHVDFIKHWDTTIIEAWKSAKNEMAVMTTYLSDVHGAMDDEGNLKVFSRPIMCRSDFEGTGVTKHLRHGQQPEGITAIKGEPTFEPFWAAGFSFSRGHFIINVPYDQHLPWVFQGEEISIGLRGFTYGYDYYAPEHSVCFHYYASADTSGKRGKVNLFWEHSKTYTSSGNVVEKKGMKRLNGILNMNPPSIKASDWLHKDETYFGTGKVRTTQKFFETFGIDTKKQVIQDHLCKFVGRHMQRKWKPHLRKDTMGVNYDEIDYKFKDPDIFGTTW